MAGRGRGRGVAQTRPAWMTNPGLQRPEESAEAQAAAAEEEARQKALQQALRPPFPGRGAAPQGQTAPGGLQAGRGRGRGAPPLAMAGVHGGRGGPPAVALAAGRAAPVQQGRGMAPAQGRGMAPVQGRGMAPAQGRGAPLWPQAQPSAAAAAAGGPWSTHQTAEGRTYYYNRLTKQSSWTPPPAAAAPAAAAAAPAAEKACAWKEYRTPEGRAYYHNHTTNESKWEPPEAFLQWQKSQQQQQQQQQPPQQQQQAGGQPPQQQQPQQPQQPQQQQQGQGQTPGQQPQQQQGPGQAGKAAFLALLREKGVDGACSWERAMQLIIDDRRYQALYTLPERKAAFAEYVELRRREEQAQGSRAADARSAAFLQLLAEHSLDATAEWARVAPTLEADGRFAAFEDDLDRQLLFEQHLQDRAAIAAKGREAGKAAAREDFLAVLSKSEAVTRGCRWRDVRKDLEQEASYKVLGGLAALQAFEQHLHHLEDQERGKSRADREALRRQDRHRREAFRDLLERVHKEGALTCRTTWREFSDTYAEEAGLKELASDGRGSTPGELFGDYLEELELAYEASRAPLAALHARCPSFAATSVEAVRAELERCDARAAAAVPSGHLEVFCADVVAVEAKEKERELARVEKRKHRLVHLLGRSKLQADASWEEAQEVLKGHASFTESAEEDRRAAFDEWAAAQAEEDGEMREASDRRRSSHSRSRSRSGSRRSGHSRRRRSSREHSRKERSHRDRSRSRSSRRDRKRKRSRSPAHGPDRKRRRDKDEEEDLELGEIVE